MTTRKILISLPNKLVVRLKTVIPARQRSKVISQLIEHEVAKREKLLYECAVSVEKDQALRNEMKTWDSTLKDGIDDESW